MGKLNIVCGNIVSDEILKLGDAIVNPTNPMMRPGAGVSGEIFRMAGFTRKLYISKIWDFLFQSSGKKRNESDRG